MKQPFEGDLSFYHISKELPLPTDILKQYPWSIDEHNAPYLAGKAPKPTYGLVELTREQALGNESWAALPAVWSEADTKTVIGDIGVMLDAESDIFVACTSDFKGAEELAKRLGYRPAFAGEFLQSLVWLQQHHVRHSGWFYCYAGRMYQYAILVEYYDHRDPALQKIIFDTYIGDQIKEGLMSANMDTNCIFVQVR